jgi:hypothetical protein
LIVPLHNEEFENHSPHQLERFVCIVSPTLRRCGLETLHLLH